MTGQYTLVERVSTGLARIRSDRHGAQTFALIRTRSHLAERGCAQCGTPIAPKAWAWKPDSRLLANRGQRICTGCVDRMPAVRTNTPAAAGKERR